MRYKKGRFEERMRQMKDPFITYSMWDGYLKGGKAEDPDIVKFIGDCMDEAHMTKLHTSGHAYVETLAKLIQMTNPKVIIPMHTEFAKGFQTLPEFAAYRDRVREITDGEEYRF